MCDKIWQCLLNIKVELPPDFRQYENHRSWKHPWGGLHSKWYSFEMEEAMVRRRSAFILILFCKPDLLMLVILVQRKKYHIVIRQVYSLVDERDHVTVLDSHCTQLPIVDAKLDNYVFFVREDNWWYPLNAGGFDNYHGQQVLYLLFLEFSLLAPCSVWGWAKWVHSSVICLLELA